MLVIEDTEPVLQAARSYLFNRNRTPHGHRFTEPMKALGFLLYSYIGASPYRRMQAVLKNCFPSVALLQKEFGEQQLSPSTDGFQVETFAKAKVYPFANDAGILCCSGCARTRNKY
jgi:hypothetical protein